MTKPQPEQLNEKLKLLIIVVAILNVLFFGIWFLVGSNSNQNIPEITEIKEAANLKECYGDDRPERGTDVYNKCYTGQYDIQKALKESDAISKSQSSVHDEKFDELMEGRQ